MPASPELLMNLFLSALPEGTYRDILEPELQYTSEDFDDIDITAYVAMGGRQFRVAIQEVE